MDILRLFFDCDEFWRRFEPRLRAQLLSDGHPHRQRQAALSTSEVMTIIILFQCSGFRNFKTYYTQHVAAHLRREFPRLVSYQRFVELQSGTLLPLAAFLHTRFGTCSGISFIDATPLKVCHNLRINAHKVFRTWARRGKTSTGWFYGFKVHLVICDSGQLLGVQLTPGNVDDRKPAPRLARRLWGKLFGDRGYISKELFAQLWAQDVQLITKMKKNMKPRLLPLLDKLLAAQTRLD